jgi:hypothetical protein
VKIKRRTRRAIKNALIRAGRTYAQAFVAVISSGPVLHLNVPTLKAAAAAGMAALLSLAMRALDYSSIPTPPAG